MRIAILSLSLVLLLCPPSAAQEIVAHVQADQQEWEWVGTVPYWITVSAGTEVRIQFLAQPDMTPRQSVYFDFMVGGTLSLDSFTVPGGFVNEGQWVETEQGWTQEVHLTDLGGCLDPSEPTLLAEFVLSHPGNGGVDLHVGGPEQPFDYRPYGTDCSGGDLLFDGLPTQACINCPDPIETTSFGTVKALYD